MDGTIEMERDAKGIRMAGHIAMGPTRTTVEAEVKPFYALAWSLYLS